LAHYEQVLKKIYPGLRCMITVSLPLELLERVEAFSIKSGIFKRSIAISYLLHHGLLRLKEIEGRTNEEEKEEDIS